MTAKQIPPRDTLLKESHTPENGATVVKTELLLRSEATMAQLRAKEYAEIIDQRKKWSYSLLALVVGIVVADMTIVGLVGMGVITFGHSWELPSFIAATLLEVFALCQFVVRFLFNPKFSK